MNKNRILLCGQKKVDNKSKEQTKNKKIEEQIQFI